MGRGKHEAGRITGYTLRGYEGLAAAVFSRSVRDVQSGNGHAKDALAFLGGPWAAELLEALAGAMGLDLDGQDLREVCEGLKSGG